MQRVLQPERMDDPGLPDEQHHAALRGLERINRISLSSKILWPAIRRVALQSGGPLRLLDVATGGGDVPIALARRAASERLPIEVHACDISLRALEYARRRAEAAGASIRFFTWDAVGDGPLLRFDIVTSSLFLHHLSDADAERVLGKLRDAAGTLLLINDLRRSMIGWLLAWAGTRVLSRSPVVHEDGPQSVRAAFTVAEMAAMARRADLHGASVRSCWPWRFLLEWHRA